MSIQEAVITLLHVSALVGALGAAYAGLDRGSGGKTLSAIFPEAQVIAASIVNTLGIAPDVENLMDMGPFGRVKIVYPAAVIFVIAANRCPLGAIHKVWHWFYRLPILLIFQYFRNRLDRIAAGLVATGAFALFFYLAHAIIFQNESVESYPFLRNWYWIEVGLVSFLIGQALLSWWDAQAYVIAQSHKLEDLVKERLEIQMMGQRKDLRTFRGVTVATIDASIAGNKT